MTDPAPRPDELRPDEPRPNLPRTVYLVPTPIGNLGDITLRALEVLRGVDAIAAEDTRRSRNLLSHFHISKPVERLDAHTMHRARGLLERYPTLAFVTDAGTPGLSDPGAELVQIALEVGARIESLPGATALIPALVLSGLPTNRFAFHGFLPRSGRDRREQLEEIASSKLTNAFYESPHRLVDTLQDLERVAGGDRACSVARELSKLHEEIFRGPISAAIAHFSGEVRGEIVVILGPKPEVSSPEDPAVHYEVQANAWAAEGLSAREIRARLMLAGMDRNAAYGLALNVTKQQSEK
jgi:16S rRNA (cytidine1402-2'-O)-methyltransferase